MTRRAEVTGWRWWCNKVNIWQWQMRKDAAVRRNSGSKITGEMKRCHLTGSDNWSHLMILWNFKSSALATWPKSPKLTHTSPRHKERFLSTLSPPPKWCSWLDEHPWKGHPAFKNFKMHQSRKIDLRWKWQMTPLQNWKLNTAWSICCYTPSLHPTTGPSEGKMILPTGSSLTSG